MGNMSNTRRRHLRGAACEVDENHVFSNFCEEYAEANDADTAQKRAAADQRKEKAEKWLMELREFKPVLSLNRWTINQDRVKRMTRQLQWHRDIGNDNDIPPGFHSFNKQELWDSINQAIERYQKRGPCDDGECPASSLLFKL